MMGYFARSLYRLCCHSVCNTTRDTIPLETSHERNDWRLNLVLTNINDATYFTRLPSQPFNGWLKEMAPTNMFSMSMTLLTSQSING